jgi:hypothetical protein
MALSLLFRPEIRLGLCPPSKLQPFASNPTIQTKLKQN